LAGASACTATGVTEGGGEVGAWDALAVLVLPWTELPWTAGALAGGLVGPPAGEGPWPAAVACGLPPTPETNLYPAKPRTARASTTREALQRPRRRSRFRSGMDGWKASAAVISLADRQVESN